MLITAVRLDSSNISRSLVLALAEQVELRFDEGMGASFEIKVCALHTPHHAPAPTAYMHRCRMLRAAECVRQWEHALNASSVSAVVEAFSRVVEQEQERSVGTMLAC